jgi:D-sedoheptulose 7-phosphate isomerase
MAANRAGASERIPSAGARGGDSPSALVDASLQRSADSMLRCRAAVLDAAVAGAEAIIRALHRGNKICFAGNGGSAADAQHLASEFVGRFKSDRRPLPAMALTVDTSILTSIANDFGFENVFARQIEALLVEGDILVALSTSGNSPNVAAAAAAARRRGATVIALTGRTGGRLAAAADIAIKVPDDETARVQECHEAIGHAICTAVDAAFAVARSLKPGGTAPAVRRSKR